jgi:hypothetical protein
VPRATVAPSRASWRRANRPTVEGRDEDRRLEQREVEPQLASGSGSAGLLQVAPWMLCSAFSAGTQRRHQVSALEGRVV